MASLEPVGRISEIGLVTVLNPHAIEGVNSLETLLTFGRKNPGKLTFASSGIGTTSHLAGMLFRFAPALRCFIFRTAAAMLR